MTTRASYDNSSRYFENRDCVYYPCHEGTEHINCLFCYCPLYPMASCPGHPKYHERDGVRIKICTDCTFPHEAAHYDAVIEVLKTRLAGPDQ